MERIRKKPFEIFKSIIIAVLTVTMLLLAGIYIGGSQFALSNAAITAKDMPEGAVAVGNDAPLGAEIYEKGLISVSYAGIRFGGSGGGAYAGEQAVKDLFEFASEYLHDGLSQNAVITETDFAAFQNAITSGRYIYLSFVSALPYQALYALTGEYISVAGSNTSINVDCALLSFGNDGKVSLLLRSGEEYYLSSINRYASLSELAAMASDSRLSSFTITENAIAVSDASPHTQTLTLYAGVFPTGKAYTDLLTLLDYDASDAQPASLEANIVAPHGTLTVSDSHLLYTAPSDGGIPLSNFLDNTKNTLDIGFYDILLASANLLESLREAYPPMTGGSLTPFLDGFYHDDDTFTVVFGLSENSIPISGKDFPHLARITVSGGRFKSIELRFIGAERSGKTASPFPSKWEYTYAAKHNSISAFCLRYNVDQLKLAEYDARWFWR